jgi:hypothetical protein
MNNTIRNDFITKNVNHQIEDETFRLNSNNKTQNKSNNQRDMINTKSISSSLNFFNSNFIFTEGVKSLKDDVR